MIFTSFESQYATSY